MSDQSEPVNISQSGIVRTDWKSIGAIVVGCVWLYSQYEEIIHKLDLHNISIQETNREIEVFSIKCEAIEARIASLEVEVGRISPASVLNSSRGTLITSNARESKLLRVRDEGVPYLTTNQIAEVRECSSRWILASINEGDEPGTFFYHDEFGFKWPAKKDGKAWLIKNPFLIE
jgi:hypothetical protein